MQASDPDAESCLPPRRAPPGRAAGRAAMQTARPRELAARPARLPVAHRLGPWTAAAALAFAAAAGRAQPAAAPEAAASSPVSDTTTLSPVHIRAARAPSVAGEDATVGALGDLPLIETPFSVNVVTRELIDRQQAMFLGDLLKNEPAATVGNVAVPFLLLRGFPVGTDGSLVDGLPGHGGFSDGRAGLQFIDRVEVLKGASAVLYGTGAAGSLGGVVNYIPKRPTDTPVRAVGIGIANRSLLSLDADLGGRFGEGQQFGVRLNLGWRDGEQAVARYDWNQQVAALMVDWRAAPGLRLEAGFDHVANHLPELPPFYLLAPGLAVPEAPDARRSAALRWDDFKTRSDNLTLRADAALGTGWALTVQALDNRQQRPVTNEARFGSIDNADGDITLFGGRDVSSNRSTSVQAVARGSAATGPLRHRLAFGASFSRQRASGSSAFLGVFASNLYDPVDAPEPAAPEVEDLLTNRTAVRSTFVTDTIDLGEHWSVLLGLRRARITVRNFAPDGSERSRNDAGKTLPTAALMWKPAAGALVYLNHARGLEQGGALSPTQSTQFLPPRETKQLELGAKLDHGGLAVAAALFEMQRPLEIFDAGLARNVQRGEQRHRGFEVTANGRLTPSLTVASGLMWLDTKLSGTGDPASDGKQAVGVPRLSVNFWGEYRVDALPGVAVSAGANHSSRQYLDAANTQGVPGWTRFDLGASWSTRVGGVPTTWRLTIENVADRHYWASAQGGILTIADPRTIKLGARFAL